MKRTLALIIALIMLVSLTSVFAENKKIDKLEIQFVPSKDADVIMSSVKGLDQLMIAEFAKHGYDIGAVNITVGAKYETTGEGLSAGSIDIGWLPGGTYALFSDEVQIALTATRAGLSNDSENPMDWNGIANKTLRDPSNLVKYYRSLIYATPSAYGKELAAKVKAGEKLTWEDLNKATWAIGNVTSSAGYIYPTMWLMKNYDGKRLTDLEKPVTLKYADAFAQAAAEQVDIIVCYADGRNDYEMAWTTPVDKQDETGKQGMGRKESIWEELTVLGVTPGIYNDTVAITKAKPEINNPEFLKALQDTLINIINTEEGKKIFAIYSHHGYAVAEDKDYDGSREALKIVKESK